MQAIIVTGDYKEIANLALEMQRENNQTVMLNIDGKGIADAITGHMGNHGSRVPRTC